jgi:hypothetical protein
LLHAAIGGPDGCDGDNRDGEIAEAKELWGRIEVEGEHAAPLQGYAGLNAT